MATNDHSEGIRLQAERVVRAYKELRNDAHSANFVSGQFPVGLYVELMQQIKLLEGWLEPIEAADGVAESKIEAALRHIETARRLADVCSAAVKGLDVDSSGEIALTMGNELYGAIDDAHKALAGGA